MNIPIDIHTHPMPPLPGTAIVSCTPESFRPQPGGWYSVGIHPWEVTEEEPDWERLRSLLQHPQVVALGEAGLDKLAAAPLARQAAVLEQQARMADAAGKPLVLHVVRAADELLRLQRLLRPAVPWLIHGFRGKPEAARMYLRHGFCLSFGARYHPDALKLVPDDLLLLETDESSLPIELLLRQAADVRGVTAEALRAALQANVRRLFFDGPSDCF